MSAPDHPSHPRRRSRGGRPPLPPRQRRSLHLPGIRLSPAERAHLDRLAGQAGLPLSAFVRRSLLRQRLPRPVPAINREAWTRLSTLAANLNQHVKAIHQGQAAGAPLHLLEQLQLELANLRLLLLGRDPEHPPTRRQLP